MSVILRIIATGFVILALYIPQMEPAQADAWSCLEERCCSIDFSKMLTTVDVILYACGQQVDGSLTYSLYLDTGEEMDYLAYHPYKELDETKYCADICDKVIVCVKSKTFEVKDDNGGTAEWCFYGNVDVNNKTLYSGDNICLVFHNDHVDIPVDLINFLQDSNIW
ncbi:uncharacterized protein [Eurosta solidaginis]|uniref:uncharacterized protein n=1 Tax=Eurosta solidaginis TaxID=178769 RepID=UPI00353146AF